MLSKLKQPPIVFQYGDTYIRTGVLDNQSGTQSFVTFVNGYMKLGTGLYKSGGVTIALDFSGYSELHIVASADHGIMNGDVGFNTSNKTDADWKTNRITVKADIKDEYVFDISQYSGMNYICFMAYSLQIYDIWLQ